MKSIIGLSSLCWLILLSACEPQPASSPNLLVSASDLTEQNLSQADRGSLFLNGFFPIGVFSQPEQSFAKWKTRGINTILETPQGHDPVSWDRAAQAAGLKIIRRPLADPKADIGRKDLLAWSHWDEPDAAGRAPEWTPGFEKTAKEWRSIDPKRSIFINFAGPDLSWFTTRTDSYSTNYASFYPRLIATADWIANDLYPSGGWLNQAHQSRRGDVTLVTEPLKILKGMTKKPLFAFIETSEVEKGNIPGARCPTANEVRAQIWLTLIHGVRGLFYFPAVVGKGGFQFDGTPPEIVSEITRQNALITQLAPVLQGEINPSGFAASASGPVEVGWRKSGASLLIIVVNTKPASAPAVEIKFSGTDPKGTLKELMEGKSLTMVGGTITTDLAPLGVKLFVAETKP
jgi:hypothetical protein